MQAAMLCRNIATLFKCSLISSS